MTLIRERIHEPVQTPPPVNRWIVGSGYEDDALVCLETPSRYAELTTNTGDRYPIYLTAPELRELAVAATEAADRMEAMGYGG